MKRIEVREVKEKSRPAQQAAQVEEEPVVVDVKEGPTMPLRVKRAFTAAGKGGGVATIRLTYVQDFQSSAGGNKYLGMDVYTDIIQSDPDWSILTSVFDQYKVMDVGVTYVWFAAGKTDDIDATINGRPRSYVVAYDPTDSATPTSEGSCYTLGTAKVGSMSTPTPKSYRWKNAAQTAIWLSTAVSTNPLVPQCGIKFACDGNLGVSASMGKAYYHATVQFRMRK